MRSIARTIVLLAGLTAVGGSGQAWAQTSGRSTPSGNRPTVPPAADQRPLHLASYPSQQPASQPKTSETTTIRTEERAVESGEYKEISSFFNIREANANLKKGEWELEFTSVWETGGEGDDDIGLGASLKYGFSDDTFLEVELVPVLFGDGSGNGAGETELQLFHQFVHESDRVPAFGAWIVGRFPTGDGSSGVDGELHGSLTKTLAPQWRAHLAGFIETANGATGGEEEDNRRDFQWGLGPGVDYQFDEKTIGVLNYLHRSSEEYGQSNKHILELGAVRELAPGQHLKVAVDINLDHSDDEPNFGAKVQWAIEW